MDTPRKTATRILQQLTRAIQEMSDEEFDRLLTGERQSGISVTSLSTRTAGRKHRTTPLSEDQFRSVHTKLGAAKSREEGQRIVGEEFRHKEEVFAFAKFLDLPVQRRDKVERIRDRIIAYTVGRRLSGEAIRGRLGNE